MPAFSKVALFSGLIAYAAAQKAGSVTPETNPSFPTQRCTRAGGCVTVQTKLTLDSNWRWTHDARPNQYTNCYTGSTWNTSLCPDPDTCAANCALEGADYPGTYGIGVSGNALTLKLVTRSSGTNVGGRVYLVAPSGTEYEKLTLVNQEFTFDVDVSKLPCGVNGALYTVEMPLNGGTSSANTAGVKYGTGYCDAQCPHDLKWIGGKGNVVGWNPSSTDSNAGHGQMGACCSENDIWEANSISTAFTPHTCDTVGLHVCDDPVECGDGSNRYAGVCDKDGCDFNPYRQGQREFYGPGKTVDTTKKITVVSQYVSSDGTNNGDLVQMRRYYVQDGVVIANPPNSWAAIGPEYSLNDAFCVKQKTTFGDNPYFNVHGAHKGMGDSLKRGHVLALSIWVDHAAHLLWLNSPYPVDRNPEDPGIARGTCSTTSGDPAELMQSAPNSQVIYSNIRVGELCSTFTNTGNVAECGGYVPIGGSTTTTSRTTTRTTTASSRTTTPSSRTTTTSSRTTTTSSRTTTTASRTTTTTTTTRTTTGTGPQQTKWGQCGGIGYSGPTQCVSGSTCQTLNPYYSQCL